MVPTRSLQLLMSATATEARPRRATGRKRMMIFVFFWEGY